MEYDRASDGTSHRAAESVWDKRGWHGVTIEERLGPWCVSLAGASLLVYGATRRSWRGVWYMMSGLALIGSATSGLCNPRDAQMRWRHLRQPTSDPVTIESMDSFPASDAPSSNSAAYRNM